MDKSNECSIPFFANEKFIRTFNVSSTARSHSDKTSKFFHLVITQALRNKNDLTFMNEISTSTRSKIYQLEAVVCVMVTPILVTCMNQVRLES